MSHKDFLALQKDLKNPVKDKEANTGKFKYTYCSLETVLDTVMPVVQKHGFTLNQVYEINDTVQFLTTKLEKDNYIQKSSVALPLMSDPQDFGKTSTYIRRYAICALLGITSEEDDDAQSVKPKARSIGNYQNTETFEPSDYVIQISKKFAGKKLKEIPLNSLTEIRDYLSKNKRDHKGEQDLQMITAFLNHGTMMPIKQ